MLNRSLFYSINKLPLEFWKPPLANYCTQNCYGISQLASTPGCKGSLGIGLVSCQFLDGVLTYFGLTIFGYTMEGNLLLRNLMELLGIGFSLIIVKSVCIFLSIYLYQLSKTNFRSLLMMSALIFTYVYFALIPWTRLLFS
jgi:uncharacterized membrane protein